uniref:UDP-glycosyltransferase 1 n=1 Tax=Linum usitatissimum TaxID=4006 RepID=I2BH93_LINUS|nr:UDP-glycosyltransferase 1 [Linum usitatissimum]
MESSPDKVPHVLLVCFPGQGHINPFLRLANLLASHGLLVTFCINKTTGTKMKPPDNNTSIQFDFFDEGLDDEQIKATPLDEFMNRLEETGRKALPEIIQTHSQKGQPVCCIVNNPFLPWVSDVAASLDIPSAIFWMQACASFSCYYHYYKKLARFPTEDDPESDVVLPFMPVLKHDDIPTFLLPSTPYPYLATAVFDQFAYLDNDKVLCILMETFQELEPEVIRHLSTFFHDKMIKPVGPVCLAGKISGGDLMEVDDNCIKWLDGKDESSVVYVSLGSIASMDPTQREEFAYGLINSGLSFLWVVRPSPGEGDGPIVFPPGLEENGKVVKWAPQEEVLRHPAVACFVTHCGWNSTMEAISGGKPVVTFSQWGDQVLDAKLLVDVFEVGVKLGKTTKLVKRDVVERCLVEATVGEKAEVLRRNATRLKKEAQAAVVKDGLSTRSIVEFVEEVKKRSFL